MKTKKILVGIFKIFVYLFALAGFVLIAGFFAVRFHWTDTKGAIDENSDFFELSGSKINEKKVLGMSDQKLEDETLISLSNKIEKLSQLKNLKKQNYCLLKALSNFSSFDVKQILRTYEKSKNDQVMSRMIGAVALQLQGNAEYQKMSKNCENIADEGAADYDSLNNTINNSHSKSLLSWESDEEWQTVKQAILKDKRVIEEVSAETNIEPRLIVACTIGEQLRLFHSERQIFKKYFEPLKILGNANQISLGVMGIKEATASQTIANLKNPSSQYYLGGEDANLLDFPGDNRSNFDKLTDETHYHSYLFGAVYIKEILKQWKNAGYDIKYRPEIIGTLFNVGFPQSKPKADPKVGGSQINIDGNKYSFGRLTYEFYYSGELQDDFPIINGWNPFPEG